MYKIPEPMQLQKETKCLVRLAFDQETIIRNIELDTDVTIKQVRVAEVMQVELIDPSAEHPFEIRSISDEEQFLEKGDYTEWVFYVKPLLEGTFPLVLKISVIEMVQGKERLRNLTWEETIQITTSEPALSASEFKPTGIAVGAAETDTPEERFMPPAAPAIDAMIDIPSPAPAQNIPISPLKKDDFPQIERYEPVPQPKRKPKYRGWLAAAASVLLILTVAIFMLPNSSAPTDEKKTKPNPIMDDSSFVLPPLDSLIQDTSTSPQ
ncbi:MAG: hypothetical protein SFU99_17980 [Saprospiraceae bacterium]|nr:hypothetical protein [Saprospiraceae bacterium]